MFLWFDYDIDTYPSLGEDLFLTTVAAKYAMEDKAIINAQIIKVIPGWP